jgi:hypothetical protein
MYLNDNQINQMAQAALSSYEMTADWASAFAAAQEFAIDEIGVRPNRTAVLLAVKIAKVRWMAIAQGVKRQAAA